MVVIICSHRYLVTPPNDTTRSDGHNQIPLEEEDEDPEGLKQQPVPTPLSIIINPRGAPPTPPPTESINKKKESTRQLLPSELHFIQ